MTQWYPTDGKPPKNPDQAFFLRFHNGTESRYSYTKAQMVWAHRGWDFDIVAARKV